MINSNVFRGQVIKMSEATWIWPLGKRWQGWVGWDTLILPRGVLMPKDLKPLSGFNSARLRTASWDLPSPRIPVPRSCNSPMARAGWPGLLVPRLCSSALPSGCTHTAWTSHRATVLGRVALLHCFPVEILTVFPSSVTYFSLSSKIKCSEPPFITT